MAVAINIALNIVDVQVACNMAQHDVRAVGEILLEQTVALGGIMMVNGVELALGGVLVHVAAVVTPACGFGVEGRGDDAVQTVPQPDDALLA